MNLDEFSKQLIERAVAELNEKSECNHSGAGTSCPRHGDADCNSSKQNRAEAWEGSKEDKDEDKKLAKKNKMSLKTWEKSDADKKHDMKKEEAEKEEKGEKKHKEGKAEENKEKMKEARDMPGNQEKIDANKNGKVDANDFAILRAKKGKKSVKEMWEKAAEVQEAWAKKKAVDEGKKVEIEIMPEVDTPNDPEPPTGKKAKKEVKKEEFATEGKNKEGKEQGADGKACWKGYKYAGTEGGKDKCVKAGYEMEGGEELQEKRLSKKEKAKKEKFVKGMKKKFSSMKSKYGNKAQSVMFGAATNMAKKAA